MKECKCHVLIKGKCVNSIQMACGDKIQLPTLMYTEVLCCWHCHGPFGSLKFTGPHTL